MSEGRFDTGGFDQFQKKGLSIPEESIHFPNKGFPDKLRELQVGGEALEIAEKYDIGRAVDELLDQYDRDPSKLTEDVCLDFVETHEAFGGYHPALIRAVAEAIEAKKAAREAIDSVRH